ncbi:MAG: hypothetical protein HRU35_01590 [Rickettsiaceae bacterium]|nr:hypothetical protein [Rickettsiaceae bacterium]
MRVQHSLILFLTVTFLILLYNPNYIIANSSKTISNMEHKQLIVLSKGTGGDMKAATIFTSKINNHLKDYAIKYNIDDFNPARLNKNLDGYTEIVLIGNPTVNKVVGNKELYHLANKNLFIYSHLYNPQIITNIKDIINNKAKMIYAFVAEFQKKSFQDDPEIKQLIAADKLKIYYSPLIASSYLPSKNYESKVTSELIKVKELIENRAVIHLGGSYYNSHGDFIKITNQEFKNALEKLALSTKSVTILFHPRVFLDLKNNNKYDIGKIGQRLDFIADIIKNNNNITDIKFSIPKFILQKLPDNHKHDSYMIITAPPYDAILNYINQNETINSRQYVSVDQYNAFANINKSVIPFLLNENDQEQLLYMKSYQNIIKNDKTLSHNFIIDDILSVILQQI